MTKLLEAAAPDHQAGLPPCCRHIARQLGQEAFYCQLEILQEISGPKGRQETLESIIRAGRAEGLQTEILRPRHSQLAGLSEKLPAVIELRDGRYAILAGVRGAEDQGSDAVTILIPRPDDGQMISDKLSRQAFQEVWTGGMLCFQQINTSLVCFSLVAREHKIELDRERLRHEYNLGATEIPNNTLLRMAKEMGLKAKLLQLSWNGLANLQKAYPAIAVLKNGTHMVLAGIAERDGEDPKEQVVACYDPLAGSGGGHLRLTRQEFLAHLGRQCLCPETAYKLTDETQPFSLRWFIPEILRQKITFIDIALAVSVYQRHCPGYPIFFQIVIDKVLVNQALPPCMFWVSVWRGPWLVNAGLDFLRDYLAAACHQQD